jgi:threonine aldolase
MKEGHINLYSDTQTRPSPEMLRAMVEAEVGDEQADLDPSVNRLCGQVAAMLGKEAALFLPSGTMCNEISILVHCRPGDEIYAHHTAHIVNFEAGGPSALAGAHVLTLPGERGIYTAEVLDAAIRTESRYGPRPRLVAVEQTSNLGGGAIWPLNRVRAVAEVARSHGLLMHLDGARLLNAVVESEVAAEEYAVSFDSIWIDLSKGLGCPVGAVLAGSRTFIEQAWRWKQRMGGAMRQAGILAAAGIYALEHNVEQLAQDHRNARRLGELVTACEGVVLQPETIETNLVFIDVAGTGLSAKRISLHLEEHGINIGAMGDTMLRAVTHRDVSAQDVEEAGQAFVDAVTVLKDEV